MSSSRPTTAKDLSRQQLKELREAFRLFDKNNEGKIGVDELGEVMKTMGLDPSKEELQDIIDNADKNGNRKLDFDEFASFMVKKASVDDDRGEEMRAAFKIFDKNKDGFITRSELKSAMRKIGEKVSDKQVDGMVKEADLDKDGKVNYDEFVKVLVNKI